jgi:hypothetical protein
MCQQWTRSAVEVPTFTDCPLTPLVACTEIPQASGENGVPREYTGQEDMRLEFSPRAASLTPITVRTALLESSFRKDHRMFGQFAGVFPPGTCPATIEWQTVGVIQISFRLPPRWQIRARAEQPGGGGTGGEDAGRSRVGGRTAPSMGGGGAEGQNRAVPRRSK